jgi:hypothetical protein
MAAGRIIQTTLVSEGRAASFLFIESKHLRDRSKSERGLFSIAEALGIRLVHGHDGGDSIQDRRTLEMAVIVVAHAYAPYWEQLPLDAKEEDLNSTWAKELFKTEAVITAKSPPIQASFVSLVRAGGAAIGAYVGLCAGQATPPLLLVTVPAGILICSAAMALGQAIEQGLGPRLIDLFGDKKEPKPATLSRKTIQPSQKRARSKRKTDVEKS